jgi:hypothetical protein
MEVDLNFPSPTPFLTRSPVIDSAPPPSLNTRKTTKHTPAPSKKATLKTHTVQDGVVAKPKQSKSRNGRLDGLTVLQSPIHSPRDKRLHAVNFVDGADGRCHIGCITCKKKRLKCDETKPSCLQCQKRSVTCEGYKKDFKWRSFEEATFTTKPTSKARKGKANRLPHLPAGIANCPSFGVLSKHIETTSSHRASTSVPSAPFQLFSQC